MGVLFYMVQGVMFVFTTKGSGDRVAVSRVGRAVGLRMSISYILVKFSKRRFHILLMERIKGRSRSKCGGVGLPNDLVCSSRSLSRTTGQILGRLANLGGIGLARFGTCKSGSHAHGPGSIL